MEARRRGVRDAHGPHPKNFQPQSCGSQSGKPRAWKACMRGLGKGGWKRPGNGTSSAAYSTALPLARALLRRCSRCRCATLLFQLLNHALGLFESNIQRF